MQMCCKVLLGVSLVVLMLGGLSPVCSAAEDVNDFWSEGRLSPGFAERREKRQEDFLKELSAKDPNKARELTQLQQSDPNKFREQIGDLMSKSFVEKVEGKDANSVRVKVAAAPAGQQPKIEGGTEDRMAKMRERYDEFIGWLGKNYPQEAASLTSSKQKDPQAYSKQLRRSFWRYWKIFEASGNAPLMELLKADLTLKDKRDAVLEKIRATSDAAQKQKLMEELRGIISERFDLIIKRKQMEHQDLSKRLNELKDKIEKSEAEVSKWKATKDAKVKEHIDELIKQTEKFDWK